VRRVTDRRPAVPCARALAVLGVALCATAARLPGVYDRPFWEDEVASARVLSASSLAAMLHRVTLTESTPPFWYTLAWLVHLCDVPLRDDRLLSVVFGAVLSAAVVSLALRFVPVLLAVSAGLMVALGGEFVSHGHELRAYELFALLSCLFGLGLVRVLETPTLPRYATLAATVAVGGATHYFFAFSVLAILTWLWLDPRAHAVRRRATVAIAAGGAVACVCTPILLSQYRHDHFAWIGSFDLRYVLAVPLRLFTDAANGTSLGEALSVATIIVVATGCRRLISTAAGSAVAALAVVPIVAAALAWLAGSDTFDLRNLIGVGPFVAIAVTAAADSLPQRVAVVAAAATVVSLTVSLAIFGRDQLPRYDAIARALASAGWNVHSPIAVYGDPTLYESPLDWYLPGRPTLEPWRRVGTPAAPLFVVRRSGRVLVAQRWSPDSTLVKGATLLIEPGVTAGCQAPASDRPGECQARRRVGRG
jgi:Dolichyl-phosphate-mannose-protein mannosyltransferase